MRNRVQRIGRLSMMLCMTCALCATMAPRARAADEPAPIEIREGLAVQTGRGARTGRSAIYSDPIEYRIAIDGNNYQPREGDVAFTQNDKETRWAKAAIVEKATVEFRGQTREVNNAWIIDPKVEKEGEPPVGQQMFGGWIDAPIESDHDHVMNLEATGCSAIYVNGEPRGGAIYGAGMGFALNPIMLRKGTNHLLFQGVRNSFQARLVQPGAPVDLTTADMTNPDILVGDEQTVWCGIRVVNGTDKVIHGATITAKRDGEHATTTTLPDIPPMMTRKVPFQVGGPALTERGQVTIEVALSVPGQSDPRTTTFNLNVKEPTEHHSTTFISDIDGSVQYYGVSPGKLDSDEPAALFVSLHGAGVHGDNQARQYSPKTWGNLVAPTNRRPYGFDWEDWGRLDALEVLDQAKARFNPDPQRVYLTGHSMGGHGTWFLGVTYPDHWAAIAPSAGWYSFWSYAGKERFDNASPVQQIIMRAASSSDTESLAKNYEQLGVYILHGDRDDNVPVEQARHMREVLGTFHTDFTYYERPGAGHWWGSQCCDWKPIFEFFKDRTIPTNEQATHIEFLTANPGVSGKSHWVTIETQQHALSFSKVDLTQDVKNRSVTGTTDNVERLSLDVAHMPADGPITVKLDDQDLPEAAYPTDAKRLWLTRGDDGKWSYIGKPSPDVKGPARYGLFKDAFRNHMIFVYSTKGTAEENAWSYAKARFDAETFWYRGNGAIDIVADTDFDHASTRDRNVIIYGHADMNSAWTSLLGDSPVRVNRGRVTVGDKTVEGDELGIEFIRPRPDSDTASVGVVAGSGMPGLRSVNGNRYFVSGTGYPDWMLIQADMLNEGGDGIMAAGYFGNDWSVEHGEAQWRGEDKSVSLKQ